jgi:hypothetical protein
MQWWMRLLQTTLRKPLDPSIKKTQKKRKKSSLKPNTKLLKLIVVSKVLDKFKVSTKEKERWKLQLVQCDLKCLS